MAAKIWQAKESMQWGRKDDFAGLVRADAQAVAGVEVLKQRPLVFQRTPQQWQADASAEETLAGLDSQAQFTRSRVGDRRGGSNIAGQKNYLPVENVRQIGTDEPDQPVGETDDEIGRNSRRKITRTEGRDVVGEAAGIESVRESGGFRAG